MTRDQGDLVRLLAAVLPPVLAAPGARPPGASKRRGGEDDDDQGDGYTGEGAFVPLQRTGAGAAWWWALGAFHY